ncbi:hypothetical protein BHE74_00058715 [Ensete ventricosum]|nr:hypothetical protein BHE74_00058715 [Ensete ventricosum]
MRATALAGDASAPQAAFLRASNPQSVAPSGLATGGRLQTVGSSPCGVATGGCRPLRVSRYSRPPSGG